MQLVPQKPTKYKKNISKTKSRNCSKHEKPTKGKHKKKRG